MEEEKPKIVYSPRSSAVAVAEVIEKVGRGTRIRSLEAFQAPGTSSPAVKYLLKRASVAGGDWSRRAGRDQEWIFQRSAASWRDVKVYGSRWVVGSRF